MKTAVDTSTVQTIVATQSSAFSQEPIQDTNTPSGLFVGGGLLVGGLVLAIAATNYRKHRRRRIVPRSLRYRHKVGTSDRHSRPYSNSYRGSSWSSDSDRSCTSYDSSPSSWTSDSSSSCSSYDSSSSSSDYGGGSSGGGGAGSDW